MDGQNQDANEVTTFLGDDGAFTDSYRTELPTKLGDAYNNADGEPTKVFDDVNDVWTLSKNYLETKRMNDTKIAEAAAAQIAEQGLVKPLGENPSEQEIAAYREARGVPATAGDYGFAKPEGLPEGMPFDDGFASAMAEQLHAMHMPAAEAKALFDGYTEMQVKAYQQHIEATDQAFGEAKTQLTALPEWSTDEKVSENARVALDAVKRFADKDLQEKVKEMGLWEKPTDLDAWRKAGFWPDQLMLWQRIGQAMQSGTSEPNEHEHGERGEQGGSIYTHASSQAYA